MRKTRALCFKLVSLIWCVAAAQPVQRILPESALYDHLEHFRALGYWSGGMEVRPISGDDLVSVLRQIEQNARERPVTAGDARRLHALRKAASALTRAARQAETDSTVGRVPPSYWNFGGGLQYFGQATGLDSLPDLDRRPRRDAFFHMFFETQLPSGFYAQWRFYQDYSSLTPDPGDNNWVDNLPPNLRDTLTDGSARNDVAVLGYGSSWFNAEFGRRDRHWGPGRRGTLFISENPFPLDGLSLQIRTRYVVLTSLFAQSQRGNPELDRGSAYVAAHRVEIRPPLPFRVGLFESVAYANRTIDLAYTNPVGFLLAMSQDIYDRSGTDDKKQVGIDFVIDLRPVSLYGEFLIDRVFVLDAAEQGEGSPASSFAQLAGLRWANPFGLRGSDLDLEYAHLDPQVYFHKDGDVGRSLLHEDELIGHWLGPNADGLFAAWTSPPIANAGRVQLFFEQARFGIIDGQRGVDLGFFDLQRQDKEWITGDHAVERILALSWVRRAWPTGWGALDTTLTAARVERSGAFTDDDGWLIELRLIWQVGGWAAF